MITCPSCSHQNPDGATHCEACYTSLPVVTTINCPNCGASVQSDASFCGHCGFNLHSVKQSVSMSELPESIPTPDPEAMVEAQSLPEGEFASPDAIPDPIELMAVEQLGAIPDELTEINAASSPPAHASAKTQLQQISASLLHVQTNVVIEIPHNLSVVHIGKPNSMIPPDIDVSGFPDSDIVSRVHGDVRFDGDAFYFEDTGSSNGTYINNTPLSVGNRHRLRAGDRISLGKGDKVSFVFQMS